MARTCDLTPAQMKIARQIRGLRLRIGMGVPRFGKLAGMDSSAVTHRESLRVPWREPELQAVLSTAVNHLKMSLGLAESLARAFVTRDQNQTESTNQEP